jgi:hypothetical protein
MTTNPHRLPLPAAHRDGLETRFGTRVCAQLGERASAAAPDISERLRFAREQALARAAAARRQEQAVTATSPALVLVGRGGSGLLARHTGWWVKLASAVPLAMLAFGLVAIDRVHDKAQIAAVAEVDAALLADDLPPAAYTDPGFVEYLKNTSDKE